MQLLVDKARYFLRKNKGHFLACILGQDGAIAYRVKVKDKIFHVYYARDWYRNYQGISIPKNALQKGLDENAMIVIFINKLEYWLHSSKWIKGKNLTNKMYGTNEVLVKKIDLEKPGIEFPKGVDQY